MEFCVKFLAKCVRHAGLQVQRLAVGERLSLRPCSANRTFPLLDTELLIVGTLEHCRLYTLRALNETISDLCAAKLQSLQMKEGFLNCVHHVILCAIIGVVSVGRLNSTRHILVQYYQRC